MGKFRWDRINRLKFLMIIIGGEIKMCKASDAYNHKKYISAWAIEPDFIVFK